MTKIQDLPTATYVSVADRFAEIGKTFEKAAQSGYPAMVEEAARIIGNAFEQGNKLLVFGNGGSASDAQHLCGELVVRFQKNRRALPAIALCCDASVMTACANDFAYVEVFARQVEALGRPGDVALGISTSGSSPNVLKGLETARSSGLTTILLTGVKSSVGRAPYDLVLAAPGENTARVQELHLASYHSICELIETRLFGSSS